MHETNQEALLSSQKKREGILNEMVTRMTLNAVCQDLKYTNRLCEKTVAQRVKILSLNHVDDFKSCPLFS